jgi:mono/diheme cytochrome c family protein
MFDVRYGECIGPLVVSSLLVACGNVGRLDFKAPDSKRTEKAKTPTLEATFASLNENIFKPKCLSCHVGTAPTGKADLSSYEKIMAQELVVPKNPSESLLFAEVAGGKMPPPPDPILSSEEKDAIHAWIMNGALKEPTGPTPTPTPNSTPGPTPISTPKPTPISTPQPTATPIPGTPVRYPEVAVILQSQCVSCHKPPFPDGLIDLTTYKAIRAKSKLVVVGDPEKSKLWTSIKSNDMPQKANPLTALQKQLIYNWIKGGALE